MKWRQHRARENSDYLYGVVIQEVGFLLWGELPRSGVVIWKGTGGVLLIHLTHLTHNNLKITDEEDMANHLAETFSQNSSTKNQSKSFQIIKTNTEKVKIKFQSQNTESCNQSFSTAELKEFLNKAHNTAVGPDKINNQFLKELPEPSIDYPPWNLQWYMEQQWHP